MSVRPLHRLSKVGAVQMLFETLGIAPLVWGSNHGSIFGHSFLTWFFNSAHASGQFFPDFLINTIPINEESFVIGF